MRYSLLLVRLHECDACLGPDSRRRGPPSDVDPGAYRAHPSPLWWRWTYSATSASALKPCPSAIGQLANRTASGPPIRRKATPCQKVGAVKSAKIVPITTKMTPKIPTTTNTVDHSLSAP